MDGGNLRRAARHLKAAPQTVSNWVSEVAETLPNASVPTKMKTTEMDELFTFIGDKESNLRSYSRRSHNPLHPVIPSCANTLRDQHVSLAVSLDVRMFWSVNYVCLSSVSTAGNFTNSVSQFPPLMSWTLLAHYFRHSPESRVRLENVF